MRDPKIQALYGLKFNPFLSDIPLDALHVSGPIESFLGRCENHLTEGGFALLTGVPGLGKSVTLRLLDARLSRMRDVLVRTSVLSRRDPPVLAKRDPRSSPGGQAGWGGSRRTGG